MITRTARAYNIAGRIQSTPGMIIVDNIDAIEIMPADDSGRIITLNITNGSYIIDAVSGKPASLSERKDDRVVAYFQTDENGANTALALIINIPEDYSPPIFAKAVQVKYAEGRLNVMTDRGVVVSISGDIPIELFLTRNAASINNITENTDLLLWNQAYNMSIPARTAANRVVILGNAAD